MSRYRDELAAAQGRVAALEERLAERERKIAEREAELERLKAERRGQHDARVLDTTIADRVKDEKRRKRGLIVAGAISAGAIGVFAGVVTWQNTRAREDAALAEAACAKGADACVEAGLAWERAGEPRRAVSFYQRACDDGSLRGCDVLGNAYRNGFGGLKVDYGRALGLHRRACDGGVATGCSNVGWHLLNGFGVPADPARALELFEDACARGAAIGCNNVGWVFEKGFVGPVDREKALEHYDRACRGGNEKGCSNVARLRASSGT